MRAANDNLPMHVALIRTGFYGLNAFCVAAVVAGIGLVGIPAATAFAVAFMAFAKLGERR